MEILKPSTRNIVECEECGNQLRYEARDIAREHTSSTDDMERIYAYSIYCPCGYQIDVTSRISSAMARHVERVEEERRLSEYDV